MTPIAPPERKVRKRIATVPNDTRERIVRASIELFNRHGVPNVPLSQIAGAVDISPGNLTYHFRKRDDLVYAAFLVLQERMNVALHRQDAAAPLDPRVPRDAAEYLIGIMRTFWEFRFLFNSLTYLLKEDQRLRDAYFKFQEEAIGALADGLQAYVRLGHLAPMKPPNSTRLIGDNMWTQWLNWLRVQQIVKPDAAMPDGDAQYDCALHHWSLLRPYWTDEGFGTQLLEVYGELLLKRKRRAPGTKVRRTG